MEQISFSRARSILPKMDEGANTSGKRYVVEKYGKPRLVVMSWSDYAKLVVSSDYETEDEEWRQSFLELPLEERRTIMEEQASELAEHYQEEPILDEFIDSDLENISLLPPPLKR